ncbi:MAG: hypothetical protein K6G43_05925 [Lachnospiraceae bacterium]|jgi:hypothetical protein|nr:hypothetical protein [Lachnospiraceae bacterium]
MAEEKILTETEIETEAENETEKPQRRKGQPKGKDIRPLHVRTAKTSALWVMAAGIGVFILMLAFWSQMNVGLILDATKALGETTAEAIDKDAAVRVSEYFLELSEGAPDAPTADYKSDEQVVVLARYDVIAEDEDYKALHAYLSDVSDRYPYAGEFSLVGVNDDQLIYLVSPQHRTGYSASLDRIDTAGPEHYDISRPESRREGTVVLVPLGIKTGGIELEISCSYSYGGVLSGEAGHLVIALAIVAICAGICAFRMVWIILRDNG